MSGTKGEVAFHHRQKPKKFFVSLINFIFYMSQSDGYYKNYR